MKSIQIWIAVFLTVFCLSGCYQMGARHATEKEKYNYGTILDYSHTSLNLTTRNFLYFNDLMDLYEDDPISVIKGLEKELFEQHQLTDRQLAIVLCSLSLRQMLEESGETRQSLALTTALAAWRYLNCQEKMRPEEEYGQQLILDFYNVAATELFRSLLKISKEDLEQNDHVSTSYNLKSLNGYTFEIQLTDELRKQLEYMELHPCADFRAKNFKIFSYRRGIGVPLIAAFDYSGVPLGIENRAEHGLLTLSTLLVQFEKPTQEYAIAKFVTYAPDKIDKLHIGTEELPLAMDITTNLAYRLDQGNIISSFYFFFRPDEMERFEGLYFLTPYDPNKIPVVLTHGLFSNPRTFLEMLNSLLNDDRIRHNYQFWLFAYPTGDPVLFSAQKLRTALDQTAAMYGHNPDFNKMVLIGHSMGGLLSKTVIQNTGNIAMEEFFDNHFSNRKEIYEQLGAEDQDKLRDLVEFSRKPYVKMTIFMAVPHKGAEMATWSIARWASDFVLVSKQIRYFTEDIAKKLQVYNHDEELRSTTGLDNLRPDHPAIRYVSQIPFDPQVELHSIIGNQDKADESGGSDGVVPYWSSHLDQVLTETIVKSGHSVQHTTPTIHKVHELLIKHLIKNNKLTPEGKMIDGDKNGQ